MIRSRFVTIVALVSSTIAQALIVPQARAGDLIPGFLTRHRPPTRRDCSAELLAKEIDYLQFHIDTYGTVVPKAPDVWGQARLTKHRQEYESVLQSRLCCFQATLQGSLKRSDQSFLGLALAVNSNLAAAPTTTQTAASSTTSTPAPSSTSSGGTNNSSGGAGTSNPAWNMIDASNAITRTGPTNPALTDFSPNNISLEPTELLGQLDNYLHCLHELRRINEGDDNADSPGYSLNLVRIPISVTPGKKTRKGHGAEITIIAQPYLSDDLLPSTMRNLVINDVVDQLGLGLLKILENSSAAQAITDANNEVDRMSDYELRMSLKSKVHDALSVRHWPVTADPDGNKARNLDLVVKLEEFIRDRLGGHGLRPSGAVPPYLTQEAITTLSTADRNAFEANLYSVIDQLPRPRLVSYEFNFVYAEKKNLKDISALLLQVNQNYSTTRPRRSDLAYPPSQIFDIFGGVQVFANLLKDATPAFKTLTDRKQLGLLDVEAWLRRELEAAYDFLKVNPTLWTHCSPELVRRIQARAKRPIYYDKNVEYPPPDQDPSILGIRDQYFAELEKVAPSAAFTGTEALSWAIIVESAMLNNRLTEDMKQVAAAKGCQCLPAGQDWLDFYLPEPSPQARAAFNQYVMCRWPIHVFALDPVIEEQNVADQFSRRREMQLAIAVGVANGNVSANAAMRFMRRLELDMETIALNRTVVGFSYGEDTFGWRFYPRLQSPPTVRNGRAFIQTLTGGPTPDQDMNGRQLEPGMRECEAIVVMPSFVPYVLFDTRSNWFCLTHPRQLELTLHDSMKLSRMYQGVRQELRCVHNACEYRPGDVSRMTRVVDQLDRQMPLQTMTVQVPYENTLGGFEMFATGVTDIGPEFKGFYGEPGVKVVAPTSGTGSGAAGSTPPATSTANTPAAAPAPAATSTNNSTGGSAASSCPCNATPAAQCANTTNGTTLFIVGKHFSVHDTQVVAGSQCVPFTLISREIMRVTIPSNVNTVTDSVTKTTYVDVHAATPNGVTSHLSIPVVPDPSQAQSSTTKGGLNWDTTSLQAQICFWPLGTTQPPAPPGATPLAVQDFRFLSAPSSLTATDTTSANLRPVTGVLQFHVTAQNGTQAPFKLGDSPAVAVTFNPSGKFEWGFTGGHGPGDLIATIVKHNLTSDKNATQINVDTYVNYDQPAAQGLPVIKFDKPLTIALTSITCPYPGAAPVPAAPAPAPAPAAAPAPAPTAGTPSPACPDCPSGAATSDASSRSPILVAPSGSSSTTPAPALVPPAPLAISRQARAGQAVPATALRIFTLGARRQAY